MQDQFSNNRDKIPLLGDAPISGPFFRSENRSRVKTNLMVFLRPFIVRDDAGIRGVTLDRYERMRTLGEGTRTDPSWVLPNIPPPELPPAQ